MRIKGDLFDRGYLTGQPSLSDVLANHERQIISRIKRIPSLDEMTDSFLSMLIKESLAEPVIIHFDRWTRQTRTEDIDGSEHPFEFVAARRGKKYPRTVVRISIPFDGDHNLLRYTPSSASGNFPVGQVIGNTIQFDITLWGYTDDERRVKEELDQNIRRLKRDSENSAKDMRAFNETIAAKVKAAFEAKLDELTKQHAIFDNLGIKEEERAPVLTTTGATAPKPKKERSRVQITQFIETMYVKQLNQTNVNVGDVNNAIQSD